MNFKAIIFDFDGVIVDSVRVKIQAFYDLYLPFGETVAKQVAQYHEQNGGISRFEKISYFHQHLLKQNISEEEVQVLANRFSELVKEKVISAAFVSGVLDFLEKNYQKYLFFVSTGTPETEILEITKAQKIDHYFKEIYGSPDRKIQHIERIMQKYDLKAEDLIFIGDSPNDRDSARHFGIRFIGRIAENTEGDLSSEPLQIGDFIDFERFIAKL